MDLLQMLTDNGMPIMSVILLGALLSVCPCTMAANVTALTCMLKQEDNRFLRLSLFYVLARVVAYSLVGILLCYFVEGVAVTKEMISLMGKLAGPLFLVIGLLLLDIVHIHGLENKGVTWMNRMFEGRYSVGSAVALGLLLAFAFCPYSAAIYFGVMIPLSCSVSYGLFLPLLFSVGTAIPLFFIIYLMKKGLEKRQRTMEKFKRFEKWYRIAIAVVFIVTGLLFIWEYYID